VGWREACPNEFVQAGNLFKTNLLNRNRLPAWPAWQASTHHYPN
jgi:hypothetical protein